MVASVQVWAEAEWAEAEWVVILKVSFQLDYVVHDQPIHPCHLSERLAVQKLR